MTAAFLTASRLRATLRMAAVFLFLEAGTVHSLQHTSTSRRRGAIAPTSSTVVSSAPGTVTTEGGVVSISASSEPRRRQSSSSGWVARITRPIEDGEPSLERCPPEPGGCGVVLADEQAVEYNYDVAIVQPNPIFCEVERNLAQADMLLASKLNGTSNVDLLILPEMGATGYAFESREQIEQCGVLEEAGAGPTFAWASRWARALGAYVFAGYPEREGDEYYNSGLFVSPEGVLVKNIRKNVLTDGDRLWATASTQGFQTYTTRKFGKIGFGICRDMSGMLPKGLGDGFALDNAVSALQVDLILVLTAWEHDNSSSITQEMWLERFKTNVGRDVILAIADRVGSEKGTNGTWSYGGSSTIIGMRAPTLLGTLNQDNEDALTVHVHSQSKVVQFLGQTIVDTSVATSASSSLSGTIAVENVIAASSVLAPSGVVDPLMTDAYTAVLPPAAVVDPLMTDAYAASLAPAAAVVDSLMTDRSVASLSPAAAAIVNPVMTDAYTLSSPSGFAVATPMLPPNGFPGPSVDLPSR